MTKIVTGAVYVRAPVPSRKGGTWSVKTGTIGADTAEDAAAFAAVIVAAVEAQRARELKQLKRATSATEPCAGDDGTGPYCLGILISEADAYSPRYAAIHTGRCRMMGARMVWDKNGEERAALAAALDARRGIVRHEIAKKAPSRRTRTASKAPPAPPRRPVYKIDHQTDAPSAPRPERGHRPPPCQRCGKTFKTDAGASWHAVNNPHCEKYRVKVRAA